MNDVNQLDKLKHLHNLGVISDDEFDSLTKDLLEQNEATPETPVQNSKNMDGYEVINDPNWYESFAPTKTKTKRIPPIVIIPVILLICIIGYYYFQTSNYNAGIASFDDGNYAEAQEQFEKAGWIKDASKYAKYSEAISLMEKGKLKSAAEKFDSLPGFEDADHFLELCAKYKMYCNKYICTAKTTYVNGVAKHTTGMNRDFETKYCIKYNGTQVFKTTSSLGDGKGSSGEPTINNGVVEWCDEKMHYFDGSFYYDDYGCTGPGDPYKLITFAKYTLTPKE